MKIFIIFLISLFLVSCVKQSQIIISENIKVFSQFPKEEKIEFEKLVEFKLGNPRQIITIDSTLIFANFASGQENYLHNYSLSTGKFSKPYISRGRNLNEILGLATIGIFDNYLWLNDFTGKKMMLLDKDKVIKDSLIDLIRFSFKTNRNYRSILIDSLQIITTGNSTSKFKVQIFDLPSGNVIEEFGELKSYDKSMTLPVIT